MAHKIIGTAGHIDHGKSRLVLALTGTDPDRLNEEQKRGMTIDLGFAFLNDNIAFIDVPGHEKFIKNMVAGVSTVDVALLVVAADDGVMPQTREHLDILQLLQLERGLIALTKIDMVEKEWLDVVEEDIRDAVADTFLQDAPLFRVSAANGQGIPELRQAIIDTVAQTPTRPDRGIFWMPVDRSFTIKGHGTVVTGSVLSGSVQVGDSVDLLPAQRPIRIRGIQTHGRSAESAHLGDRAALNLHNISKDDIQRGDVLATSNAVAPTTLMDAKLHLLASAPKALPHRARVRLHLGTREIMARVKLLGRDSLPPGHAAFVQFVLEEPAVAQKRDAFVIRRYSPQLTIGGGIILDTRPKPHRRSDRAALEQLQRLETFDPLEIVTSALLQHNMPLKFNDLARESDVDVETLQSVLEELLDRHQIQKFGKDSFLHQQNFQRIKNDITKTLQQYHQREPLRPGLKKANLLAQTSPSAPNVFEAALQELQEDNSIAISDDIVKLRSHTIQLSSKDEQLADEILAILEEAKFSTPPVKILAQTTQRPPEDVQRSLDALQGLGKLVRLEGDLYFTVTSIETAKLLLHQRGQTQPEISVAEFREMLNTSRKFAVPLLNYFDDMGVTERLGDVRRINV